MLTYGKQLGISTDETILYSILRDRVGLSLENGKMDANRCIYIFYSRENAAACLGWSVRKTSELFQALVNHGLLVEQQTFTPSGKMRGKQLFVKLWQDVNPHFTLTDIQTKLFQFATP